MTSTIHLQARQPFSLNSLIKSRGWIQLERNDTIPVDSWALKMVSNEWHAGEPVTAYDVSAATEHFGLWKGQAFW